MQKADYYVIRQEQMKAMQQDLMMVADLAKLMELMMECQKGSTLDFDYELQMVHLLV